MVYVSRERLQLARVDYNAGSRRLDSVSIGSIPKVMMVIVKRVGLGGLWQTLRLLMPCSRALIYPESQHCTGGRCSQFSQAEGNISVVRASTKLKLSSKNERAKEFLGEHLIVEHDHNKLFCER